MKTISVFAVGAPLASHLSVAQIGTNSTSIDKKLSMLIT